MKLRNIGILVAAVMVIAATGLGSASASVVSWGGTDKSYVDSSYVAHWDPPLVSGTIYVTARSDQVTWDNRLYNADPSHDPIKAQISWSFSDGVTPQGYERKEDLYYSQYWFDSPVTETVRQTGTFDLGVNHRYTTDYQYDAGTNTGTHLQQYVST